VTRWGGSGPVLQRDRRRDPYPWTWEVPLAAGLAVLFIAGYAAQAGRSVANLLAGAGWAWPTRAGVWSSLPGLVGGHADAGLTGLPSAPAAPVPLWGCVVVAELTALFCLGWGVTAGLDRWGPARVRGMASRAEAEALLGVSRLRRARFVVRPDLYGRPR